MAYGIYLVTVTDEHIEKLKEFGTSFCLNESETSKIAMTTHYFVSNGTSIKEFDDIFIEAIESGDELNEVFWHPLRVPRF